MLELDYITKKTAISDQKPRLISIKTIGAKNVSHSKMLPSLNNHQNQHFCLDENLN